jgi:hypothetical protein
MINDLIENLNSSKYFSGIMMLLLNVGSKHISKELSFLQDDFLNHKIIRRLLIFVVVFIATKDIKVSFLITLGFIIIVTGFFHEESKYCILPKDKLNKNISITKTQYLNSKEIIKYYEKQNNI